MAMSSHLDALSPGMRAKLDPLFRITMKQGAACWPAAVKSEAGSASRRYNLGTIERYKRHQESRIKVASV